MWVPGAKCCNCVFYSLNSCYCNLRNMKNSPEGNCADFLTEDSVRKMKGKKCCNCVFYSLNNCYCNARNIRNAPDGNCANFRSM